MATDYILYSDGGAELRISGGSACIIEDCSTSSRVHLAANLGGATNNEAEIFAGLLGFAYIKSLDEDFSGEIRWVCDSEYVLKSATQYINNWKRNGWQTAAKKPVKNQGLWQAYSELSSGIKVIADHVRGHTGHPENEACDSMTNWVRANEDSLLGEVNGVPVDFEGEAWTVFDSTDMLNEIRGSDDVNHEIVDGLIEIAGGASEADPAEQEERNNARAISKAKSSIESAAESLSQATSKEAEKLLSDVEKLLKKFD